MPIEHQENAIEKGLLTLWIIWAAILGSLFIYVFICYQFGDEIRQTMSPNFPVSVLRNILYGVAIITLFLTHFLRRFMLSVKSGNASAKSLTPGTHSNQSSLLAKYTTALILSLALSESIGIYGFVLVLLGDDFQTLYIFTGISALALYFYRPKREEIEALAFALQTEQTSISEP